jgi:hypothetical protein
VEAVKQGSFPIDEVDAQTLYTVIRELHERRNLGVLYAAHKRLGEILEGEKWPDQRGDTPEAIQG